MKAPKRKYSHSLSKRTHLTQEQLKRVAGQAGNGLASRYGKDGVQSLVLTRRLAKAQRKATRFVLYSDQLGKRIYVSATIDDNEQLTFDKKGALQFIDGFDNPETKVKYWNTQIPILKFKTTHI